MTMDRRSFGQALSASLAGMAASSRLGWGLGSVAAPEKQAALSNLSVMLWTLRPKYSAQQAIDLVARAGYNGFELVEEDKHWSAADVSRVRAHIGSLGVKCDAMSGVNTGFAEPGAGQRLIDELIARMAQAESLGCRRIILLSGKRVDSMTRDAQHAVCVANLKRAGDAAAVRKFELLIEPIDAQENPPIYLTRVAEAFSIARATKSPAVKVLYDFYHEQRGLPDGGGVAPLLAPLAGNIDLLGLVHIADVPGRRAPGTGTINYAKIYEALRGNSYRGWMAMEFLPLGDAETELRAARQAVVAG